MMEKSLYFAYGSNINLDQMQYRCPDATVYGQAVLDNYDLRFRGSGVATVEPKEGACVYGLLWELPLLLSAWPHRKAAVPAAHDAASSTRDHESRNL